MLVIRTEEPVKELKRTGPVHDVAPEAVIESLDIEHLCKFIELLETRYELNYL